MFVIKSYRPCRHGREEQWQRSRVPRKKNIGHWREESPHILERLISERLSRCTVYRLLQLMNASLELFLPRCYKPHWPPSLISALRCEKKPITNLTYPLTLPWLLYMPNRRRTKSDFDYTPQLANCSLSEGGKGSEFEFKWGCPN